MSPCGASPKCSRRFRCLRQNGHPNQKTKQNKLIIKPFGIFFAGAELGQLAVSICASLLGRIDIFITNCFRFFWMLTHVARVSRVSCIHLACVALEVSKWWQNVCRPGMQSMVTKVPPEHGTRDAKAHLEVSDLNYTVDPKQLKHVEANPTQN